MYRSGLPRPSRALNDSANLRPLLWTALRALVWGLPDWMRTSSVVLCLWPLYGLLPVLAKENARTRAKGPKVLTQV